MAHMRFGAFLAPHHPIGENPTLQLQNDLKLVSHLDELGYDEFWCGEHHSTGWEVIASPEIFLAAAAERTQRIKLGTGVISLPYHHPFMVAQRLVQLDHQSRGRLIFGSGPGALPSDAHTLGLDPMLLRDRQDEAMGVIRKLFQKDMEFAVASQVSPSGMTLAGKHQAGVLSIGAMVAEGMRSLPTQWSFAEESAAKHGNSVDRRNWRIVMNWHVAETRKEARLQAKEGLLRHNNDYSVATLNPDEGTIYKSPDDAVDGIAFSESSTAVIGTPDDLIAKIKEMISITGGFGCVIGFAHDWANRENTLKSWDLVARYVIPEINGLLDDYRESHEFVTNNREIWVRAREAVMNKIESNERSAEIMKTQGYEGEKSKS